MHAASIELLQLGRADKCPDCICEILWWSYIFNQHFSVSTGVSLCDSKQPPVALVASKDGASKSLWLGKGVWKMRGRILIADDSPFTRKTLQELLQANGWKVCGQAENGLEAVRMAVELNPDAVILDLAMPSMDGLTAARQISKSLPTIPIVMHTLHDLPQLEQEAKKNGVRCIVRKSETARIISVLDELTHRSSVSPQAGVEKEPVTRQATKVATSEGTGPQVQAVESASQTDTPDDIAKAS